MDDFFKYLATSEEDQDWGLFLKTEADKFNYFIKSISRSL